VSVYDNQIIERAPLVEETTKHCAAMVLGAVSLVLRVMTEDAPNSYPAGLSIQQLQALMVAKQFAGSPLSLTLRRMRSTVPEASRMIDELTELGYVTQTAAGPDDESRVLSLTYFGERALASVHLRGLSSLLNRLSALSPNESAIVRQSLDILRSTLAPVRIPLATIAGQEPR
jgi:DNA-binding MarR family transcriptional regulator